MPNRILKESICSSENINSLTWFEEIFFYRLIVNADDYGRMDARPAMLKAKLFPLKNGVTEKQISEALNKLSTAGMVQVYEYDQKPFLQLRTWNSHQQIRAKKSKYPAPDSSKSMSADNGYHLISDDCKCPRESNPNTNPNTREKARAREEFSLSQKKFQSAFPNKAIDCDFDDSKYDIDLLIRKVGESEFLKTQANITLNSCLKYYDKIISDGYKDFKSTAVDSLSIVNSVTTKSVAELNGLFESTNPEDI